MQFLLCYLEQELSTGRVDLVMHATTQVTVFMKFCGSVPVGSLSANIDNCVGDQA